VVAGNGRALEQEDLYDLSKEDSSAGVYALFSSHWKKQLVKRKKQKSELAHESDKSARREPKPSLSIALLRAFGGPFAGAGLLKLVHDSLIFVGPLSLNKLILILGDPEKPVSLGLFYVAAIFLSNFCMSLCLRQYFWWCYRVGMRLRSAVTTSVYSKALSLSTAAMSKRTTGEISNLMSVDASRLQELAPYLHAVWYSVYQIAISLYFLWQQMGVASLAGIAVILLLIPMTGKISTVLKRLQSQMAKVRDERIKISNEVLGGMKVIKFQAWEGEFEKRINEIRDRELVIFRKYCIMQSLSGAVFTAVPLLVSIVTFTTYIATGHVLDVATALTSLALFEILRFPLFMLPNVLNNLVEAKVSVDRVQGFLLEPERELVSSKGLQEPGLFMQNSTLIWDGQSTKKEDSKRNRKATDLKVPFLTALGRRWRFLFDQTMTRNEESEDLESGRDRDEEDTAETIATDTDNYPLILGDNEESHLMSVFRAQVDVSEARIRVLERDLKLLRLSKANENVSAVSPKTRVGRNSSHKSLEPEVPKNVVEDSLAMSPLTVCENETEIGTAVSFDKHDNPLAGKFTLTSPSKITDASDEKWHETRNPLAEETKEGDSDFIRGSDKGADRLLTLSRITLQAKQGDLVAIVGQVGSGKSSLLGGLLGDMKLCLGSVGIKGSVAYMGQRPFIQNSTLRDNITFGLPFDQQKYSQTLFECALLPDLKVLPGGDMTEIGERGINLSGGQKARVALARAVYADATIYLLDDPLAAVDAHVGQHLFEQSIMTLKRRNKCVILVTNALQFLRSTTSIVVLRDGQIVESGSYEDLLLNGIWLNEMIKTHLDGSNSTGMSKENSVLENNNILTAANGKQIDPIISALQGADFVDEKLNEKLNAHIAGKKEIEELTDIKPKATLVLTESGKLLTTEDKEVGDVSIKVPDSY
jgi:ABC-type multidrug transport system fused ATPase/permease subunit